MDDNRAVDGRQDLEQGDAQAGAAEVVRVRSERSAAREQDPQVTSHTALVSGD